jgi:hypothetical protein
MAWRNLRQGRSDRRGAVMAGTAFILAAGFWALSAGHVASMFEATLLIATLGMPVFIAVSFWLVYIALEPYVRRNWPDALVSWTRLCHGQFADPRNRVHPPAGPESLAASLGSGFRAGGGAGAPTGASTATGGSAGGRTVRHPCGIRIVRNWFCLGGSVVLRVRRRGSRMDVDAPPVRLSDELDSLAGSGNGTGVATDHHRLVRGPFHGGAPTPDRGRGMGVTGHSRGAETSDDRICSRSLYFLTARQISSARLEADRSPAVRWRACQVRARRQRTTCARAENRGVDGSIPPLATIFLS